LAAPDLLLRVAHLVGEEHRLEHQQVAVRADRHQILLAAHHQRADRGPAGVGHGVAQQCVRAGRLVTGRGEVVGLLVKDPGTPGIAGVFARNGVGSALGVLDLLTARG
jgi:hypothetical protein